MIVLTLVGWTEFARMPCCANCAAMMSAPSSASRIACLRPCPPRRAGDEGDPACYPSSHGDSSLAVAVPENCRTR